MEFQLQTDLTLLCRICMQCTTDAMAENIYAKYNSDKPSLYSMLKAICAPVFSSDDIHEQEAKESFGMSKVVCSTCKKKVAEAYKLHEMCVESDRKFWEMIMVKQELQDDENDPFLEETVNRETQNINTECISIPSSDSEQEAGEDAPDVNSEVLNEDSVQTSTDTEYVRDINGPDNYKRVIPRGANNRTCDLCSQVWGSVALLNSHMKDDHPSQVHQCDECELVFFSLLKLDDHRLFHKTGRAFPCEVCKKRFKTMASLRYHARTHINFARFKCDQCDKSFLNKSTLARHLQSHAGVKPYPCKQCPLRFVTRGGLTGHMRTHSNERKFVCDICGSRFTVADSLIKHNRIHTGERPYPCTICGSRFISSHHLKRHMRTHTGEKPYKCAYCPRAFAQSNDLAKHTRFHVGENPYKCDICDSSFRLMTQLRNHYKVHYEGDGKPESGEINERNVKDNEFRFTIVSVLNRGYQLTKQRGKKGDKKEQK